MWGTLTWSTPTKSPAGWRSHSCPPLPPAPPSAPALHGFVGSAHPPLSVLTAAIAYASFSIPGVLRTFHRCRTIPNPMGVRRPMWKSCNFCFVVQRRTATSTTPTSSTASWNCAIPPTLLAAHQPKHCLVTSFVPICLFTHTSFAPEWFAARDHLDQRAADRRDTTIRRYTRRSNHLDPLNLGSTVCVQDL